MKLQKRYLINLKYSKYTVAVRYAMEVSTLRIGLGEIPKVVHAKIIN